MQIDYFEKIDKEMLVLQTTSTRYEDRICSFIDKDFIFNIKDLDLVKSFGISNLVFEGYLQIELNDHLVYTGPTEGGKYLSVVAPAIQDKSSHLKINYDEAQVYNGKELMPCFNNQIWAIDTRINLKPLLQEGNNTLNLRFLENNNDVRNIVKVQFYSLEYCPSLIIGEQSNNLTTNQDL